MTDTAWTVRGLVRAARRAPGRAPERTRPAARPGTDVPETDDPSVASGTPASRAALHTAAAERLAESGRWEPAYRHLREAVRLLHGQHVVPRSPQEEMERLRRAHAEAHEQSRRDSLTASYNRRYLDERLAALLGESATGTGLCVALADIDHFKQVNDTHGHQFGDRVLQRMVVELGRGLPEGAFCARYGGEEFALVLPGESLDDGIAISEAARDRIATHDWSSMHPDLKLTISIGVAHAEVATAEVDPLIGDADLLLYTAKQAGRNAVAFRREAGGRVELAGPAAGRRSVPQPADAGTGTPSHSEAP
ncbi:diguanylate cyclase (GGDEF)-like protein [Pseudonocardia sediminis]|uniref:Diguanylate cyclase (GGDEF)-like protein n=1 Tax=Pseudonocardia sediminis TaxID=1397368 RepID=A0A4Q7URR7_PSEST|nr:GGDEF domain-containing protein [Pseudonocardia sediminis]RZT83654.1 diguanylate cyclase (GGDEF)-like protein [Pseudonocardia sediminis]